MFIKHATASDGQRNEEDKRRNRGTVTRTSTLIFLLSTTVN